MPKTSASESGGAWVEVREASYEPQDDASQLAQAFGSTVVEPAWWPDDTGEISYTLDRFPNHASYRVGGIRNNGVPIAVIGLRERPGDDRSPRDWLIGEWDEPSELAHLHGVVGRVGSPVHLQAFLKDCETTIVMIGFETEREIFQSVSSFRRASPR